MAPVAGFNGKVRVNNTLYSCVRWSVRDSVGDLDITNTEGVTGSTTGQAVAGFETRVAGCGVAEISITNASWDPNEDPFATPRSIIAENYARIQIYINGTSGPYYLFYSALITSVEQNGEAKGLEPVSFTARSDGNYLMPV